MRSRHLPILLLPSFVAAVDFQGPAVVECPAEVWGNNECRPAYDVGRLLECVFTCPEGVVSTIFPERNGDTVRLDLPCDCIQLEGCPSTCSVTTGSSSNTTSTAIARTEPQDFEGPGVLKCPFTALIDGCDFGYKENCTFDATKCVFPEFMDLFDGFFNSKLSIPLSCSCIEAKNCAPSCEFEPAEMNVTESSSFQGVGTISCPVEDFLSQPCLPLDLGGECLTDNPECVDFDVTQFLFNDDMDTVKIPLPCGCLSVAGCPTSCTFAEGLEQLERANFTGSGTVSCPLTSYLKSPCAPRVQSGGDCERSVCLASAYTSFNVQNASDIEISIPCDCLELQECSADCTFTPMDPIELERTEFSGPGSITCPFALNSIVSPCDVQPAEGCECSAANVLNQDGISVNLPCDCLTATCSSECQFTEELATLPFQAAALDDGSFFQGPGLVTCPLAAYEESPCSFNTDNAFQCVVRGNSCLKLAFDFLTSDVTQVGDQVQIPLECDCVQLVGCHESCTFEGTVALTTEQVVRAALLGPDDNLALNSDGVLVKSEQGPIDPAVGGDDTAAESASASLPKTVVAFLAVAAWFLL